eukprot:364455-Chlamydomonas_euryale.AAC.7
MQTWRPSSAHCCIRQKLGCWRATSGCWRRPRRRRRMRGRRASRLALRQAPKRRLMRSGSEWLVPWFGVAALVRGSLPWLGFAALAGG